MPVDHVRDSWAIRKKGLLLRPRLIVQLLKLFLLQLIQDLSWCFSGSCSFLLNVDIDRYPACGSCRCIDWGLYRFCLRNSLAKSLTVQRWPFCLFSKGAIYGSRRAC